MTSPAIGNNSYHEIKLAQESKHYSWEYKINGDFVFVFRAGAIQILAEKDP
jgi:hypothetical protein